MGRPDPSPAPDAADVAAATVDRLAGLGAASKAMFGGHGLFVDGVMFGMVTSRACLAFRTNDETVVRYVERGAARPLARMPYWEVPADVQDDPDLLSEWAQEALAVARAAKK